MAEIIKDLLNKYKDRRLWISLKDDINYCGKIQKIEDDLVVFKDKFDDEILIRFDKIKSVAPAREKVVK